jgi:hypothetical protein
VKDIFKPDDFKNKYYGTICSAVEMANAANAILNERLLSKGVRVYGNSASRGENQSPRAWGFESFKGDTHAALLICVEPLEKKCVEHIPSVNYCLGIVDTMKPYCKNCGVKLKATWGEAE